MHGGVKDFSKKAKSNHSNYRNRFQPWFDFIGMTPTEQIEKRLKDTASGNLEEPAFLFLKNRLPIHKLLFVTESLFY
jgi:hypothetical protein